MSWPACDREHDVRFDAMGSDVRLLIGRRVNSRAPSPGVAAERARRWVQSFEATLSRFRSDSELCALNADPREEVPCSRLLRSAVAAGLWAARYSGGLVDPTLVGSLEEAGYERSRAGLRPAPLAAALAAVPTRRPARPHPHAAWRHVEVDDAAGVVRRPPGLRLDTGGIGKGLAADALAARMRGGYLRFVVDCGGDMRVGGHGALATPYDVEVEHPLTGERAHVLRLGEGGVATSGLNIRLWERNGTFSHHLIDPATGTPAWTGVIGVTALGASTLEAETLAKAALLSGAKRGIELLRRDGGLLVRDDGTVDVAGPASARPRVRLRASDVRAAVGAAGP